MGGGGRSAARPAGRRAQSRLPERPFRGPARAGGALPASPHDGRAAQRAGASLPRRGAVGGRRLRRDGGPLLGDEETVPPRCGAPPAGRGGGGPRGRRPEPDGDPRLRDRGAVEGPACPRRGGGARRGPFAAAQRGEGARGAPGGGRRPRVVGERGARLDGVRPRASAGGGCGRRADRRNRRAAPLRPRGDAGPLPGARIPRGPGDRGSRAAGARRGTAERDPPPQAEVRQGGSRAPFPPRSRFGRSARRWQGR